MYFASPLLALALLTTTSLALPTNDPPACSTGTKAACCASRLDFVSAALCELVEGGKCDGDVYCCPVGDVSFPFLFSFLGWVR